MAKALSRLLTLISSVFVAGAANAAVVNYDESVDGDLGSFSSPTGISLNIAGVHTISGSTSVAYSNDDFVTDADNASLLLGTGVTVTSIGLTINSHDEINTGGYNVSALFLLSDFPLTSLLDSAEVNPATGFYDFGDGDFGGPYASDLLLLMQWDGIVSPSTANGSSSQVSYTWTITTTGPEIAPVPGPAALPLAASGLGLLGFLGWRRRATG